MFEQRSDGTLVARTTPAPPGVVTSAGGVGLDLLDTTAVRATDSAMQALTVTLTGPSLSFGTLRTASNVASAATSSRGVGVKMYRLATDPAGTLRAVRVYDGGIETYKIDSSSITRVGGASAVSSAGGVAVAVTADGSRAVRVYDSGFEIFDISNPASITRRGSAFGSAPSSQGVAAAIVGTLLFRGTEMGIQAYDIANDTVTPRFTGGPSTAGPSPSGVGLAIR